MTRLPANHPAVRAALAIERESTSDLERAMATHIRAAGLPTPDPQHLFHPARKWRFDFAWPAHRIAAEVHGGIHTGGRHVRGKGFEEDRQKMNAAALAGWRVFEFTGGMVDSGEAINTLLAAFKTGQNLTSN